MTKGRDCPVLRAECDVELQLRTAVRVNLSAVKNPSDALQWGQ